MSPSEEAAIAIRAIDTPLPEAVTRNIDADLAIALNAARNESDDAKYIDVIRALLISYFRTGRCDAWQTGSKS